MSATIKQTYAGKNVDHYVIASERQAPVTVRIGTHGVFCCLTCRSVKCEHTRAVEQYVTNTGGQAA